MQVLNQKSFFSLRNMFLYVVIVVLPILVVHFALSGMVEEQFDASRDLLTQELEQQCAKLNQVVSIKYQLKNFFNYLLNNKKLLRQSPDEIAKLINRLEELYPGAFKWFFWDAEGNTIPIKSRALLNAQKQWEMLEKNMMAISSRQPFAGVDLNNNDYQKKLSFAINVLQRAMGSANKVEHLIEARGNPIYTKWLNAPCLAFWDTDNISYNSDNTAKEIYGGLACLAFPEKFAEDFWVRRLVFRRNQHEDGLKFPLAAVNLTHRRKVIVDTELPQSGMTQPLLDAYLARTKEVFIFTKYLVKSISQDDDTEIRLFSLADLSPALNYRNKMMLAIRITSLFLLIMGSYLAFILFQIGFKGLSLRKRIAAIFLLAILLPILSLLSIGKSFLAHEEARMFESTLVKMRSGIEGLELRYKDTPRTTEGPLFRDLQELAGSLTTELAVIESIRPGIERKLFQYYMLTDAKGKIVNTNWENMEPALKKTLELTASKMLEKEQMVTGVQKSLLQSAVNDEIEEILENMRVNLDFSRPSHLRYFVYKDQHMYFMGISIFLEGSNRLLFIYVPDYYLEGTFANREFSLNSLAANQSSKDWTRPELSFYSSFASQPHIPAESDLWEALDPQLTRAFTLKAEESGSVTIGQEEFIYLIKPLSTMYKQSYMPCLISSKNPIKQRLREVSVVVASLAFIAIMGTLLLSLILTASLLGPISQIDAAAQQIGNGNLNIALPDMGTDEIGRLSQTFNNMVKGLREREKMQAYVSDSVLEAVRDHSDASVHAGKSLEVTILFSDIRNFTGISEQYSPREIFALLNEFFGGVEPLIRGYHGRVDKFIGDAVMAVFDQTSPEHHSLSAIKAAFAMKSFLKKLNNQRSQAKLFTIDIGVGISTGSVLLGDVGSTRRKDLTVIGDEVNLASRLETASKKGRHSRIIISNNTYNLVKDHVVVEEMPFCEIKGKQQAVQIFELIKINWQS